MAGVEQAKAGFLGFNPAVLGLGAAAGILGLELKSVFENTEAQDAATRNLAQAYGYLKEAVPTKEIQGFIDKNAQFIPSMYAVENGFASLARAGFNNTTQMRLMNDALDLSVAKGIPLEDAVATLTKGSLGLSRGLMDLGISQKDINAALGKGATESDKFAALLALLEPKIKDARKDNSDLAQATHGLNTEWEKLTSDGQPLPGVIAGVERALTNLLKYLSTSKDVDNFFGNMQNWLITNLSYVQALTNEYDILLGRPPVKKPAGYQFNKNPSPNDKPVTITRGVTVQ
jgi:hypothetical protein